MSANFKDHSPRFELGDHVKITFPGRYRDKEGFVTEIIEHKGDFVYRYRVRFVDGETATFFEFELVLV